MILVTGSLRLLLERRAENSTLHRSTLRRLLLHPVGSQTSLGNPHRRLPRPRLPPPTVFYYLRRDWRHLRRGCRIRREPRRRCRADVLPRRVGVACHRWCYDWRVHCEEQHRDEEARAGPAEPLWVLLRRRRARRIPRQRVLRAPSWNSGTRVDFKNFSVI